MKYANDVVKKFEKSEKIDSKISILIAYIRPKFRENRPIGTPDTRAHSPQEHGTGIRHTYHRDSAAKDGPIPYTHIE